MTPKCGVGEFGKFVFQYRKRYEITCDSEGSAAGSDAEWGFQYRKRYEITCDDVRVGDSGCKDYVSIPQAV